MAHINPPPQTPLTDALQKWMIWRNWFNALYKAVSSPRIPAYTVGTLPDADEYASADFTTLVYVTDETGGAVLAFSDGTDWRRVTDRAVVS